MGQTDTTIAADISNLNSGAQPTRVVALRLADGSYVFAGTVK
jgi:hypothetical protein